MQVTDIFIRRPILATVISLLIFIFGLRAIHELTLRQFPKLSNTVITISTAYPGANAELIQGFITSPIQKAIASAEGVDYITAQSADNISIVTAYIRLNFDPNTAMTDIMAKVAETRNLLPRESNQPVIQKQTGSSMALMYIGFNSDVMTNQQITDFISRVIRPKLQTVEGVADAEILGGHTYAMRVWLDTEKLTALNLSTQDIISALQAENFQSAAGQIKGNAVLFNVTALTHLEDAKQFENIVIKNTGTALLHLKDVAKIELGAETYNSSVIFNGKNAVFIGIKNTPTANPLTTINNVKKILPELASTYPTGFNSKIVYDSTDYIRASIHEVTHSIISATVIVILVIFLFLGSLRTVLIPIITIPLSLVGVCSLMLVMGYSINLLTLLAMVLAIGLVVDDAIVVVENIYRHLESGMSPFEAAIQGAREIASPIISMTTTLAAVYAPIGFMTGLTGALFKEFAFTLAFSVIISGIIALTLSPMMCSKILSLSLTQNRFVHTIDLYFDKLKEQYEEKLKTVLQHRQVVAVFVLLVLFICAFLAMTTTKELAPEEDQSVLFLSLTAPEYANINYTSKYTNELNSIFNSMKETENYFIVNGEGAENNAIAGLMLKPWNERNKSQTKVLKTLQPKISQIAGLNSVAFGLPSIPGSSDGLPVQFVLTSTDDYKTLNQVMEKLKSRALQSGLFLYVDSSLKIDKPNITIHIDREKAGLMGITMDEIGNALAASMGGNYINRFSREGESYQVIPELPDVFRNNPEIINNIHIRVKDKLIPLSTIADFSIETVPNKLNQFQQLNSVTLQGLVMPGHSLMDGLTYLQKEAKKIMPGGMSYDFAGQSRQAIQEGNTMLYMLLFSLVIIYLVLSAQFESFRDPLIIMISVPLSITGALLPLNIGLASLNIYTGIGLVTLIGLISKHGILLVEFANQLQRNEGLSVTSAILKSASLRLRPILMTTAAMVLGVIPLLFASGAGANSRFAIGLVITFGMLIGTVFTLFIVPTMYLFLAKNYVKTRSVITHEQKAYETEI